MSNLLTIQTTVFTNVFNDGTREENYGYRIYDSYDAKYDNNFDSLQEALDYCVPENALEIIKENGFEGDLDCYSGISINGDYYDIDEIDPQ